MIPVSSPAAAESARPMPSAPRIAALFDTSFGHGSPQLELLVKSLAEFYGSTDCWLIEPDVKGKRGLHQKDGMTFRRVATRMAPHGELHHIDYNVQSHRWLRSFDPDIVIVTSGATLPALLRLPRKPSLVIYYMLENMEYQRTAGGGSLIHLNRMARPWIDLICVPERDRAQFDLAWLGWDDMPVVELLNVSTNDYRRDRPAEVCRILHAGSICDDTLSHYFEALAQSSAKFDIYGILATQDMRELFIRLNGTSVSYRGVLSMADLETVYNNYAYSITMWKPRNVNQIHASPNKFFQSIARGVPPIVAPHPQCLRILRKYGCGIPMDDWSLPAFGAAIGRALDIFGSPAYDAMVQRCELATKAELNWPAQFSKIEAHLPEPHGIDVESDPSPATIAETGPDQSTGTPGTSRPRRRHRQA